MVLEVEEMTILLWKEQSVFEDCSIPGLVQSNAWCGGGLGHRYAGLTQRYKTCPQWTTNGTVLQFFSDDASIFTPALRWDIVLLMTTSSKSSSNLSNIVIYALQCALGINWCWMACSAILEPREGDRSVDPLQHFNQEAWDWWSNPRSRVHPSANSAEHMMESIWMEIELARQHTSTPHISVWESIVLLTPGDPLCLLLMVLCLGTFRSTVYGLSPCWRSALTKALLFFWQPIQ